MWIYIIIAGIVFVLAMKEIILPHLTNRFSQLPEDNEFIEKTKFDEVVVQEADVVRETMDVLKEQIEQLTEEKSNLKETIRRLQSEIRRIKSQASIEIARKRRDEDRLVDQLRKITQKERSN